MASGGSTGFTAAVAEEAGAAEQINQLIEAWEGGSDRGVPLDLTEIEHATKYALDVRNKEEDSSLLARFRNAANEVVMLIVKSAITIGKACSFSSTVAFSCAVTFPDDWISADATGWAMLEDGLFAANQTGMAKMADGFLAASEAGMAKMAAGFLAADATGQAKMANDFVDSQHYADGSIDKAHLAADVIDGSKLADDAVDTEHIADNAVEEAQINAGAVTVLRIGTGAVIEAKIGSGAVTNAKLGAASVDDTKVGNRVPALTRRQGGSATNWTVAGATTYTPTTVRMQGGAIDITGNGTLTFPIAFSQAPLVLASCVAVNAELVSVSALATQDCQLYVWDGVGVAEASPIAVLWLAIGPE